MTRFLRLQAPVALLVASLLIGCGGPDYPETIDVSGTVTLDGKPVPDAIVTFLPTDGRRSGTGYTDSSGHFTLTTFKPEDGAVPGAHAVAINPTEAPPMPGEAPVMGVGGSAGSYTAPFPPKYGDPKQSGFTAEVSPDGENDFTFDMKS
jgi:hypothetical protein